MIHAAVPGMPVSQQLSQVIRASFSAQHFRDETLHGGSVEVPMAGDVESKVDFRDNDDTYEARTN